MNSQSYSGAVFANSAFNARDPYYTEIARLLVNAVSAKTAGAESAVDVGAGIGSTSTRVIRKYFDIVYAVEPDESMRQMCLMNTMGDPGIIVLDGRGENLSTVITAPVDAVIYSEALHLLHKPEGSLIPMAFKETSNVLRVNGVMAFSLGPSHYEFAIPIGNHRSGDITEKIVTELCHPLYQKVHEILLGIIKEQFSDFQRDNIWPPASTGMNFEWLEQQCETAGLMDLSVHEILLQLDGNRVIEFIRNGWSVFFRWPPLVELPIDKKLELIKIGLTHLWQEPDFNQMKGVLCYHPTAVFTAVKK